jgi:translation initiation factor 4A
MPLDVLEVTEASCVSPGSVKKRRVTLEGISNFATAVDREEWKLETLVRARHDHAQAIYCNTRRKVDWLQEEMQKRDFTVSRMHGDMDQRE